MPEPAIPVIRGTLPKERDREYREMMNYESGKAEEDARAVPGPHAEAWLNVTDAFEPASRPAFDTMLRMDSIAPRIRGRVLDLAAGSCWLTAELSKLDAVEEATALDMSERFLTTAGARVIDALGGRREKIRFAASTFNETPFGDDYFDCVFMFACLHHSLAPIKTLMEAKRILKPGGALLVFEHPPALLSIRKKRREAISMSTGNPTEIVYTKGEFEYLLKQAGFDSPLCIPLDVLTVNPLKKCLRKLLRLLSIESVFLPTLYIIDATK